MKIKITVLCKSNDVTYLSIKQNNKLKYATDTCIFVTDIFVYRWLPPGKEDDCIKNGAKKAIWKCVPRSKRLISTT